MADIAGIFHWPPAVLEDMSLDDLLHWQGLAVEWWNRANRTER